MSLLTCLISISHKHLKIYWSLLKPK